MREEAGDELTDTLAELGEPVEAAPPLAAFRRSLDSLLLLPLLLDRPVFLSQIFKISFTLNFDLRRRPPVSGVPPAPAAWWSPAGEDPLRGVRLNSSSRSSLTL